MKFRKEYDSIGKINVPGDKYWGLQLKDQKFLTSVNFMCKKY